MSGNEISDIMAALAGVPDVDISPDTGTVTKSSGKSLGEKYGMEKSMNEDIKKKVLKNRENSLSKKEESYNITNAYKDLLGVKRTEKPSEEELLQEKSEVLDVEDLNDEVEESMMDIYVQKINKKKGWK